MTTHAAPRFTYEHWRHGGWYVSEVRYPSGAVGCVSRNYPDKKWRIVCDERSNAENITYASRDAAAAAEYTLAEAARAIAPVCECGHFEAQHYMIKGETWCTGGGHDCH